MTDGTEASGTTTPDPVGAQTSGTTDQGSVGATAEAVDWKARAEEAERKFEQSLREKDNLEVERRRRQELEQQLAQYQSATPAPATGTQQAAAEMYQHWLYLQQSDDPRDKVTLANMALTQQLVVQQQFDRDLADNVPPEKQSEVRRRALAANLPPSVVYKALKGEEADSRQAKLDAQQAELDARRKKLDEEDAARRRGRVDVTTTPVPASTFQNGDLTPTEYADLCRRAETGDSDARQRLRDFDEERTHIKYG